VGPPVTASLADDAAAAFAADREGHLDDPREDGDRIPSGAIATLMPPSSWMRSAMRSTSAACSLSLL
jgi:hypothetical protein